MLKVYDNFFNDEICDQIVKEILLKRKEFQSRYRCLNYLGGNFFGCFSDSNYNLDKALIEYKKQPEYPGFWYDYLLEQMSNKVMPAKYTRNFSKPGFQLTENTMPQPGLWHYNTEKTLFPYKEEFPDYDGDLNTFFEGIYTMTIMLTDGEFRFDYYPETDSIWNIDPRADLENTPCVEHLHFEGDNCPNPNCPLGKFESVYYKKGTLVLQDSRFMHRIGPSTFHNQDRITFQGHGVAKDGILYLHW